jgi:pyruvate dehydrogenase E1 component alpha subunit
MDDEGRIIREDGKPPLGDDEVLDAYRRMLFARTADAMSVSYQRQGRMFTYPPNLGQEAIAGAFGRVMRKEDWLVPAFRELGAWIQKGARMRDIFLLWRGVEEGNRMSEAPRMLPPAIPIASQLLHAVGIGKAMRYRREASVVFAFVGDGGTSTGDFHEALNFAAVWDAPVVFIIQNNQYAISLPLRMQTRAETLAGKAAGFGLPGLQVDGNDFLALSTVALAARQQALAKGPVLIEALTYRRGAHTTSDDPSKYRSPEEEKAWEVKDPLRRLRLYLEAKGLWSEAEEQALLDGYKREIDQEFLIAEAHPACSPEDVFRHAYQEMPLDLKRQQAEFEKYLNWKEHYPWPS